MRIRLIKRSLILLMAIVSVKSCQKNKIEINDADILHANEEQLTKVIIYDVFSPPVASRIYGYANLASYEAMRYADPKYCSFIVQIKGFGPPPVLQKGKRYNFTLAATKAFFTVAHKVAFFG